jgi:hypothetical protein
VRYFLNKLFAPETELLYGLEQYFKAVDAENLYNKMSIQVSNDHPFALMASGSAHGAANSRSLFPAVVIATINDTHNERLPMSKAQDLRLVKMLSLGEELEGYLITPLIRQGIEAAIRQKGAAYGAEHIFRRTDTIAIEIWADNILVKNELYDLVKMFVLNIDCNEYLEPFHERNAFKVIAPTVQGLRSNVYNTDMGLALAGAQITFEADYCNEVLLLDDGFTEALCLEFIARNHALGWEGYTESYAGVCGHPPVLGGIGATAGIVSTGTNPGTNSNTGTS